MAGKIRQRAPVIVWSKESQDGVRQLVGVHIEGKAEELPGTDVLSRERT